MNLNINKTVTTIDGAKALKSECRYIQGAYYRVGDSSIKGSGQCYLVNDKYCRDGTGYIVYNHTINKYVIKTSELVEGVISIQGENFELGWFEVNSFNNVVIHTKDGKQLKCINEDILYKNRFYRELLSSGEYYYYNVIPAKRFTKITSVSSEYKQSLPYNCDSIMDEYRSIYEEHYKPAKERPYIEKFGDNIGNYTFGVEFETTKGTIPNRICKKLGVMALRDGSISGLEYVTIPLAGKKGLNTIADICDQLKNRTETDKNCSMHLHIGNIPRTKSFMLAFYKIMIQIQDEMFNMFPVYKKTNYDIKNKNYTKPLPSNLLQVMDPSITGSNIDKNFDVLFKWLSMGQSYLGNYNSLSEVESHPSDPNGTSKWNIRSRYQHVNFIPLLFGNKKTIEFRIHTATFSTNKIINFLLLCSTIIDFVKANESNILKNFSDYMYFNLRTIVSYTKTSTTATELINYVKKRTSYIKYCMQNNDVLANELDFKYNYYGIDWGSTKSSSMLGIKSKKSSIHSMGIDSFSWHIEQMQQSMTNES